MKKIVNLPQLIKDNPGCECRIGEGYWFLYRAGAGKNPFSDSDDDAAYGAWEDANMLSWEEDTFDPPLGDVSIYGGEILLALAQIVGMKVESDR